MATFDALDYTDAAGKLASGAFVRVPVSGSGMRPFLRPGEDSVLLAPVKLSGRNYSQWELNAFQSRCGNPDRRYRNRSCASGRITIRRRDVVLVRHKDDMTPALMRVVHVWGTLLLLREDSAYAPYESATVSDVLGVVVEGTCRGGRHFNSSSRKWRYASKAWTASYRPRLWAGRIRKSPTRSAISMLAVLTAVVILSCVDRENHDIIRIEDGQFIKHEQPYYFIGTNFWYGPILASEGCGGDRERLTRELDSLCSIGVRNLRVLVGSDGERGVYTKVEPTLQYAPGKYNDTLLRGLDYFLVELGKRDMEAVLCSTWAMPGNGAAAIRSISSGPVTETSPCPVWPATTNTWTTSPTS